ncbi:hypothetical protein [Roseateles sp.]|uniref:WD40/YVTN/BNR-like repeat-containing protein n=1 Tax=Roseateles sp. TaxID=1971397 RepID=UPI0031E3321D
MLTLIGRRAVAVLALALITGCATNPRVAPEKLETRQGVVAVKVAALQRLGFSNGKWTELTVVENTTGAVTTLQDQTGVDDQHAIFVMPLPAGQYSIRNLGAPGFAGGPFGLLPALVLMAMTSDFHDTKQTLSGFTVTPGSLTNLGVVVAAPPAAGEKTIQLATLRDARALDATVADMNASWRRLVAPLKADAGGPTDPAQYDRAAELVRTRATYLSPMDLTRDGRLIFGTALGMIQVRSPDGQWSTLSTGSLDTLGYVKELSDGRIVAATQSGGYHVWNPTERSWTYRRVTEDGQIAHIEPMGDAGFALLVRKSSQLGTPPEIKLLFVDDLLGDKPARESVRFKDFPALGRMPVFFDGRDLLVALNHVGITRTADLHRIDPRTLVARKEDLSTWLMDLRRLPDGTLLRQRMNGMSVFLDRSADEGKTWNEVGTGGGIAPTPRFLDGQRGYDLSLVSSGMSTATISLVRTTDGGKKWEKVGKTFETGGTGTPAQLILSATGQPMVFTGAELLTTADEGKTWSVEWPRKKGG